MKSSEEVFAYIEETKTPFNDSAMLLLRIVLFFLPVILLHSYFIYYETVCLKYQESKCFEKANSPEAQRKNIWTKCAYNIYTAFVNIK